MKIDEAGNNPVREERKHLYSIPERPDEMAIPLFSQNPYLYGGIQGMRDYTLNDQMTAGRDYTMTAGTANAPTMDEMLLAIKKSGYADTWSTHRVSILKPSKAPVQNVLEISVPWEWKRWIMKATPWLAALGGIILLALLQCWIANWRGL